VSAIEVGDFKHSEMRVWHLVKGAFQAQCNRLLSKFSFPNAVKNEWLKWSGKEEYELPIEVIQAPESGIVVGALFPPLE